MKFDDLDRELRRYETAHDMIVPARVFMVARLDGRGFTRLTKETLDLEAPFDAGFHAMMVATTEHLMDCGFRVIYGYTESDEISLMLHPAETAFERKLRKFNSILAGEASAAFSVQLGRPAAFDCRISQLPTVATVVDYFRWRQEDSRRNSLSAYCYWRLREAGRDPRRASRELDGLSKGEKQALLRDLGTDFGKVPAWHRLGTGLTWERYEKQGIDPRTGQATVAERRRLKVDEELPEGKEYGSMITRLVPDIDRPDAPARAKPRFTPTQGQYLAFIDQYTRLHGRSPAQTDLQKHFRKTPPTIHQMVLTLHRKGLISRVPRQPRSLRVLVPPEELPPLGSE